MEPTPIGDADASSGSSDKPRKPFMMGEIDLNDRKNEKKIGENEREE